LGDAYGLICKCSIFLLGRGGLLFERGGFYLPSYDLAGEFLQSLGDAFLIPVLEFCTLNRSELKPGGSISI